MTDLEHITNEQRHKIGNDFIDYLLLHKLDICKSPHIRSELLKYLASYDDVADIQLLTIPLHENCWLILCINIHTVVCNIKMYHIIRNFLTYEQYTIKHKIMGLEFEKNNSNIFQSTN
jgi:hypothetical protein